MIGAIVNFLPIDQGKACRKLSSMVKTDGSFIYTLACGTGPRSFAGCRPVSLVSAITRCLQDLLMSHDLRLPKVRCK